MSATPAIWERCDGYGWPSAATAARTRHRNVLGHRGPESQYERQDRPPLSRQPHAAQHAQTGARAADLPHSARSVRGRVADGRSAPRGRTAAAGQDAVRLAAARASGAVSRFAAPHLRASRQAVAGHARPRQADHVPPGARGRRPRGVRLHAHDRAEHHHRRPAVRAHGLPLRADVFELGIGDALRLRIVRSVVRRLAECVVGTGRRAAAAPHRFADRGGEQPVGEPRVPDALSRSAGALRRVGPADQRAAGARERRRGVVARPLQNRCGSSSFIAWRSRLRRPRRVPKLSAKHREGSQ